MALRTPLLAVLWFAAAGCGGPPPVAATDWARPVAPSPPPSDPLPRLHIDGTRLLDEHGQVVHLRGVNVCSLEFDASGANWQLGPDGSAVLATLADPTRWRARAVRMPVNQQWFNDDDDYVGRVERLIDDANRRGVYVLLDVQWELGQKLDPYDLNILQLPTFGHGNTTEAFWLKASSRWANRTNLLYDLINEPHGAGDGETAQAMQTLVDAIRTRSAEVPIVVGGMNWAHSVAYYAAHPLTGANLIYSAHQYLPTDSTDRFAANFGDAARVVPVLVGEFLADAADQSYALAVADTAEASGAVGWLPWAIGCGFDVDADQTTEPFTSLARRLRESTP